MTKTIYKSTWLDSLFDSLDLKPEFESGWKQLELLLEDEYHEHKWYDDDGEKGMGMYCACGAFREVSFTDPWDGKTYQEIYEMIQKDRKLKF